jgi:hypothetical protein
MLRFFLFLWVASVAVNVIFLAVSWTCHRWLGVDIERIQLFMGPAWWSTKVRGVELKFGIVPSASLKYRSLDEYEQKPRSTRMLLPVTGIVPFALISIFLLGWAPFVHHLLTGFSQLFLGACHPKTIAVPLVGQMQKLASASILSATGVFAAKMTAYQMLPIGVTPMVNLVRASFDIKFPNRILEWYVATGIFVIYWMIGAWLFALGLNAWNQWN